MILYPEIEPENENYISDVENYKKRVNEDSLPGIIFFDHESF